jgi:hypothetical protein
MSAKIGRNEPCPCGSGAKFKKCCIDKVEALEQLAASAKNAGKKESFEDGARGASPFADKLSGSGRSAGPGKFSGFDDDPFFYDDDYDDDDIAEEDDDEAEETEDAEKSGKNDKFRLWMKDFRAKTPEELFAELNALGLPVTKEILTADAARHDSTITMSLEWERKYRQMETAREQEAVWEIARVLWEKLDPAGTPCLETAFDEIAEGYALWECDGDDDGALERWFAARDMLKASLGRISRTYDEIDRQVATPEGGLDEWAEDICCLLSDLAEERGGDEYETRRKKFITGFVAAFRDFPAETAVSLKCEPAERLFEDGKPAEADAVMEAVAAEYPCCHMVYERWAAAYSGRLFDEDNTLPHDLQKARRIAERGVAVENIDNRLELLNTVREINSRLLKTGRLEGAELEAARAAAEFEKKYKRASLEEKLNMLDELCAGNALKSFERFVEPVHFYEILVWDLADEGMIDRALGLAALLELRQPELFKYHFVTFEYLRTMVKLSGGDSESAGRTIERLMNDEPPCYEYIPLIAKAAAAGGMENAVTAQCLAAARNYSRYESHRGRKDASGDDLKFLAAAVIFGEAFSKVEAGESIDEKDLELKLFMAGWPGSSTAAAKCFVEEIASGRQPARLDKNALGKIGFQEFSDTLLRMSLQYFKRMRVEKGRGFVFSSIAWGFVVDFLMGRAAKEHRMPDLEKYFKFNKYELKDFALDRCRPFGDEKDKLIDTAAGLKLMKTVYEFLREAGTVDELTCANACAAAEWTLAKLLARYKKRAWQLGFVERL